jgi:hypothetical protein
VAYKSIKEIFQRRTHLCIKNPRCFGLQRFPVGIKQVIFRFVAQMIIDKQLGISF